MKPAPAIREDVVEKNVIWYAGTPGKVAPGRQGGLCIPGQKVFRQIPAIPLWQEASEETIGLSMAQRRRRCKLKCTDHEHGESANARARAHRNYVPPVSGLQSAT